MPPKIIDKEYLIIAVNLGSTDKTENDEDTSFLKKSKLAMKHLIQKKIFINPKDRVGIILMGASQSRNSLWYDNIVEMNPPSVANWDLIESVNELKGTEKSGNWVQGMKVVLDYINRECSEGDASITVLLFNDFKEDSDVIERYNADNIASDIKNWNINLIAIGNNKSSVVDSQAELNSSEQLFVKVSEKVNGEMITFDDILPILMIYKDKLKKGVPWKVDMDLFDMKIQVAVYVKTREDFKLPRMQLVKENIDHDSPAQRVTVERGRAKHVPVEKDRAWVDKSKTVIDPDNIITGYMYGRRFVPFSAEDEEAQEYLSGSKNFMIYGFTKRQRITIDCLSGRGSYVVVPLKESASPFYSLVKAMADENKVAIVRRVYGQNLAPKIGVLFPKLDTPGDPWCLVYIELTFAEDRRIVKEKSLESTMRELTIDQKETVGNLIDSMMLTEVEDDSQKEEGDEPFKIGTVHNVSKQHVYDVLAHRALKPNEPLPPMSDYLKTILEPPMSVQKKSEAALEQMKSLFTMKLVEKKKKKKGGESSSALAKILFGTETTSTVGENEVTEEDEDELCDITDIASQTMDMDID